ncbi:MAG: hypothetical protein RL398_2762 [Planctomycetota bacterium]|jgi:uncharacterized integral membrane protein (TIGR00698 family)
MIDDEKYDWRDGSARAIFLRMTCEASPLVPVAAPSRLHGLAVAGGIAAAAVPLAAWLSGLGVAASPLVVALLLGLLVAQLRPLPAACATGLSFASRTLLRAAIVLLGLRIGLRDIAAVGWDGLGLIVVVVALTLAFGIWLGRRLGLSVDQAILIAAGHAICGAAAIAAMDSVLRAKEAEVVRALALVTIAGTAAMLVCPLLGAWWQLDADVYGFWVGGSVHEVAQAVGAGFARGEQCGEAASLWKMVRVACLLPVGGAVAVAVAKRRRAEATSLRALVPWFVVWFAGVAVADALGAVPQALADVLRQVCTVLMTVAMAALGLKSSLRDLLRAGARPLVAAGATTLFVSVVALALASLRG